MYMGVPLGHTNYIIFGVQMAVYFFMIFRYLRKAKRLVRENFSDAEWLQILWIPRFMTIELVLFVVALCCYFVSPGVDMWLYQILNVLAMSYLVYEQMNFTRKRFEHIISMQENASAATTAVPAAIPEPVATIMIADVDAEEEDAKSELSDAEHQQMEAYAQAACQWLESSEAYINPDLTLRDVAKATNIYYKNLSRAINVVLDKSFFDLVNGYRVEKSKLLLIEKKELGLTLETIAEQCGFNTHYTYCRAFKKYTGLTTQQWLNSTNLPNH